jgi:biopolymer transport protein ExbD
MAMKGQTGGDPFELEAEINMIPLIDVALVLLIIFMVMTPALVRSQIQVQLPKAGSVQPVSRENKPIEIQMNKDGAIYVAGEAVSLTALEGVLQAKAEDLESQPVVISADKAIALEHVVTVMDTAKRLGFRRLGLGVTPERKSRR